MAIPLIINGVTFQYPQQFDKNWGPTLTNWSSAVTSGMLQKAGGSFPLTAEVDFGGSFGMKVLSIKSQEANIASTGILRLANASTGIVWRNALHSADLALTVNASNQLTFNGTAIGATTSLTDSHILVGNASNQPADVVMSGDTTITNAGVVTIANSAVTNAKVSASAAIALSKLAPATAYYWYAANVSGVLTPLAVTASMAVATDANGLPTVSSTTATELGYVHNVTSAIQTQIDTKLAKAGDTMTGVLNMGSHKIVSVASATGAGEALAYGQQFPGLVLGSANLVTTSAFTTTSATFVASNLTVSYTPKSASSQVIVFAAFTASVDLGNPGIFTIFRNSTNLGDATNGLQSTSLGGNFPCTLIYPDAPATTSPVTYTVYCKTPAGNTVGVGTGGGRQVIFVVEIAQ